VGDEINSLLAALQKNPGDDDARRRAAELLDAEGKRDDAYAVLAPLINLTGHDDDAGLPCLCKRCLGTAPAAAESAGMTFHRSFAVVGKRVLHFWMLAEQEHERAHVRESVTKALAQRLSYIRAVSR
jgi:hypothetical protein